MTTPSLALLRRLLATGALAAGCASALAHAPALPAPDATDPAALQLMRGFPPPPDKTIRLADVLKFPNLRWALHHMRQLGPTAQVWRGPGAAMPLPDAPRALPALAFDNGQGQRVTLDDWQRSTFTDALLVMHQGRVVYQRHHAGMQPHQPHALWSMSKSFTGLLATWLIHEGRLDPQARVSHYLPELADSAWADATVQQTLDMTTAVNYREDFRDPSSGLFRYLFASGLLPAPPSYTGPKTLLELLKTFAKDGEHGSSFRYKSVDSEVLGWIVQRVSGQALAQLLTERLWTPIGAEHDGYVWVDAIGSQLASIGYSATLRDIARLGEVLRSNGRLNGRQVIPEAVIAEIRKGGDREKFKAHQPPVRAGYSYHNQWWLPHDADGTFEMKGLNGQHLHINPPAQLVIVKFSSHPGDTSATHVVDRNAFAAIAAALRGAGG